MQTRKFTWEEISRLNHKIAKNIKNSYNPDVIIAIQRGGFIPAVNLSHLLGVRDIRPLHVKRTLSDDVMAEKVKPTIRGKQSLGNIKGKNVLIVDDIVGSGETIDIVQKFIINKGAKEIKTAIILINDTNLNKSEKNPIIDFWGKKINAWAIFPWEE